MKSHRKIHEMRSTYKRQVLHRRDLAESPFQQFQNWFEKACANPDILEPNAMSLATLALDGGTNIRTVLLKSWSEKGMVFYTNYTSNKAKEISANNNVSLLFCWLAHEQQIKIRGTAHKISPARTLKYFLSRPSGSQLGAWVSRQSSVISNRSLLEKKFLELKTKFQSGKIPVPDFWGGYEVEPTEFEFWQGGGDRLHDRFLYKKIYAEKEGFENETSSAGSKSADVEAKDGAKVWQICRLAP